MDLGATGSPLAFWGQYSDLYHTLEAPAVDLLEKALLARKLGRFQEARDIHDNQLPEARLFLVLALEKANFASRLGLAGDQYAILEEALRSSPQWQQGISQGEVALLKILLAEAQYDWTGGTRAALHEARTLRDQWTRPDPDKWTDVEISFVCSYFTIMNFCRSRSNWVDLDSDAMFLADPKAAPWSGLESVLGIARTHGKMFTCIELVRLYVDLLDKDEKLKVFSAFVGQCEAKAVAGSKQWSLVLVYSRLWFADMLQALSEAGKSSDELDKVRDKLSTLPWIKDGATPNLLLQKLVMPTQKLDDFALAVQLSDLANIANLSEDRLLETQWLTQSRGCLNQISHSRRYQAWNDLAERLFTRQSTLQANRQGRALLTASKVETLANTLGFLEDRGQARVYLEELARFQTMYPRYDVPTSLRNFYRGAAQALRALGRGDEASSFDDKLALAMSDCPIDVSQFYRIYRGKSFFEWSPHLLDIMIPWAKADLVAGKLSPAEVALMLNITKPESGLGATHDLNQVLMSLEKPGEAFVGQIFGFPVPVSCEAWEIRLKRFEQWLWDAPSSVDRSIRHTILGDIQHARCASVAKHILQVNDKITHLIMAKDLATMTTDDLVDMPDEDLLLDLRVMKTTEYTRLVNLRHRLDRKAMGADEDTQFTDRGNLMRERIQLATSFKAFRIGLIQDRDLEEAQTWFENTYAKLNTNNLTRRLAWLQSIYLCQLQRYTMFGTVASDAALRTCDVYDEVYTQQRIARSILRGAESVTARTQIVTSWSIADHYDRAMSACVEALELTQKRNNYHRHIHQDMKYIPTAAPLLNRSRETLYTNLIDWAQRKKARSITESLGAEVIVPLNLLSDVSPKGEAGILLRREANVQRQVNSAKGDVLELSQILDQIRLEMRSCPSLKEIMDLRDGQALNEAQIRSLAQELGKDVVFVDFVYLPMNVSGISNDILPMVYKDGRLVSANWVTRELRHARIKAWIDSYLDDKEPLSDDEPVLTDLYPLIEAGVKFSNPGDLVVLCPTNILFNIPLHAIELPDGIPWIQRNPIIYTQALSVLRLCHHAASASHFETSMKPLAVQALSAADSNNPGAADMAFASRSNASLLQGDVLTKKSFLTACADSKLINFYGHVSFDPNRPLDQYLDIRSLEAERVTVRDLFDLRLRPGTHVNLIGCQSGRSEVAINDDQLGFSTALFFAGAASMVTTLWSIDMADGSAFQEAFFDELLAQSTRSQPTAGQGDHDAPGTERHRSFLDLARASQAAVLRISMDSDGRRKPPYHWAAFTFQGCHDKFPLLNVNSMGKKYPSQAASEILLAVSKLGIKWK